MQVKLKLDSTVKKSNILNEMRNATTSMLEYRIFCICMAHLEIENNSDEVIFSLRDYTQIIGLDRPRKDDLIIQAKNLISKTLVVKDDGNGFKVLSIFKEYELKNEMGEYYVHLVLNDRILPYLKEQRKNFIRYKLYNTLFLKSFHHQRIYELLKQYEKLGERTILLNDLREFLSIKDKEYPIWPDFSRKILRTAQIAIAENTDIKFEYEGVRHGRKVGAVKFTIHKNEAYKDRLQLVGWLPKEPAEKAYSGSEFAVKPTDDGYSVYRNALTDPAALTDAQLAEIVELIRTTQWYKDSQPITEDEMAMYLTAQDRYTMSHSPANYYGYLRDSVIGNWASLPSCVKAEENSSFDTAEFFELALKRSYGISDNTENNE